MRRPDNNLSRAAAILLIALGAYAAVGCTIIRYVDPNDNGGTIELQPREVDMLVLVDLDRSAANLTPEYSKILGALTFGLQEQNIEIRKAALAPLYTRSDGAVPLLYGEGDDDGEFWSFEEAIAFYAHDGGEDYLQDDVDSDSANLALLGRELDSRAIYHPRSSDPSAAAYFEEPKDGFLVVYLTASERRCSASDEACAVDGVDAVQYFSRGSEQLSWLELPGGAGVPANKVFHAAITTPEGVDYGTFFEACSQLPNFPAAKLDVMQPSADHHFFGPFVDGIRDNGGNGAHVDLCEAMSSRGAAAIGGLAVQIRSIL